MPPDLPRTRASQGTRPGYRPSPEELPLPPAGEVIADGAVPTRPDADLLAVGEDMARTSAEFVAVVEAIASGRHPDEAVSVLLLELSGLLAAGARLGAIADIVPEGRYEPDVGREPDVGPLRDHLARLLGEVDSYTEVFDPYAGDELVPARLSDDLAEIVADLLHGIAHHAADRAVEALWWWQYSYLTTWGPAASGALRALQSLVAHVRLGLPMTLDDAAE